MVSFLILVPYLLFYFDRYTDSRFTDEKYNRLDSLLDVIFGNRIGSRLLEKVCLRSCFSVLNNP